MYSLTALLLAAVLGIIIGALLTWFFADLGDRRLPSAERAFNQAWRKSKRIRLRADEMADVWSPIDLKGDRLIHILAAIHDQELTLEQGTEVVDRLRERLNRRESGDGTLDESVWGWRRSIVGRARHAKLDEVTRLPGIVQVGDHATKEAESEEARTKAAHDERVAGERLKRAAREEAERD